MEATYSEWLDAETPAELTRLEREIQLLIAIDTVLLFIPLRPLSSQGRLEQQSSERSRGKDRHPRLWNVSKS